MKIVKYQNRILFFVFVLITFSCTKYEKGPKISFKNQRDRLLVSWNITEIYKNNNDYFSAYYQRTDTNDYSISGIQIDSYPSKQHNHYLIWTGNASFSGIYDVSFKTNRIIFFHPYAIGENTSAISIFPNFEIMSFQHAYTQYEILRLTETELWLRSMNLPNEYEIHFKKVE